MMFLNSTARGSVKQGGIPVTNSATAAFSAASFQRFPISTRASSMSV